MNQQHTQHTQHTQQRYPGTAAHPTARTTRRRFLGHTALGGLGLALLSACGKVSDSATTTSPATVADDAVAPLPATEPAAPVAETPAPVAGGEALPIESAAPAVVAPPGDAFGTVAELAVSVTYVPSGGGRIHNPYIAVWLEDTAGVPVRTLFVSFLQGQKGKKWLPDLKRWNTADQARIAGGGAEIIDAVSSPTRLPGTTTVMWDGKNDAGDLVSGGTYVLFIEAARERGPYDVISQELDLTGAPMELALADAGDLQKATATVTSLA
jgi:hypothetical protein